MLTLPDLELAASNRTPGSFRIVLAVMPYGLPAAGGCLCRGFHCLSSDRVIWWICSMATKAAAMIAERSTISNSAMMGGPADGGSDLYLCYNQRADLADI
jgi:hypothetical protein